MSVMLFQGSRVGMGLRGQEAGAFGTVESDEGAKRRQPHIYLD